MYISVPYISNYSCLKVIFRDQKFTLRYQKFGMNFDFEVSRAQCTYLSSIWYKYTGEKLVGGLVNSYWRLTTCLCYFMLIFPAGDKQHSCDVCGKQEII